jgi:hypothetical protein
MTDDVRSTTTVLDELNARAGARVSLGDLVNGLGDRAFGLLMLIFSLPNAVGLGTIPGLSTVFGLPQVIFAIQMIIGMKRPWLPHFLLDKSIAREDFNAIVVKSRPYILKIEQRLKPRLTVFTSPFAERLLGIIYLVLATIVALPIPGGNWPPAIAMALISIGIIERDGLFVLLGIAVSIVAVAIALAVIGAGVAALWIAISWIFGGG